MGVWVKRAISQVRKNDRDIRLTSAQVRERNLSAGLVAGSPSKPHVLGINRRSLCLPGLCLQSARSGDSTLAAARLRLGNS
jgi:hypothetical protein